MTEIANQIPWPNLPDIEYYHINGKEIKLVECPPPTYHPNGHIQQFQERPLRWMRKDAHRLRAQGCIL